MKDAIWILTRRKYARLARLIAARIVSTAVSLVITSVSVVSQQREGDPCRALVEMRGVGFDFEYFAPMTVSRVWDLRYKYSVIIRGEMSLMSTSSLIYELRAMLDSAKIMPELYPYRREGAYVVVMIHDTSCVTDTIVIEPGQVLYRGKEYIPHAAFIERVSELMPAVFGKDMREEFKRIRAIRRE